MKSSVKVRGRRPPSSRAQAKDPIRGRVLDAVAREALDRCAWIIARCGYSPEESARRFQWRCKRIPTAVIRRGLSAVPRYDLAAHVLTLWSQESDYLLPNAALRPLSARGPAPSIEALVEKVGGGLTIESALKSLLRSKTLRRSGGKYVPRDSWVVAYPSDSLSQHSHHMRVFVEFLRTLDHNTQARQFEDRWFQYAADNAFVPVREIAALSRYVRTSGMTFLKDKDALMYRMARGRKGGEATIPVSIGVYISQGSTSARSRKSGRAPRSPVSQRLVKDD